MTHSLMVVISVGHRAERARMSTAETQGELVALVLLFKSSKGKFIMNVTGFLC